jgi:hypothetical protein
MIANNFNDLVRVNGNLHPLIFWKPCLRSLGYPSRHVSGYLETLPPPGTKKRVGGDIVKACLQGAGS